MDVRHDAGITGRLTFSGGRRSSLEVQVHTWDAAERRISQVGSWSSDRGINITTNNTVNISQKGNNCYRDCSSE